METWDALRSRRSIRRFSQRPVEWELVGKLLEAGRHAPSAGNLQTWRFIVVTEEMKRKAVAHSCEEQPWISHAPVIIVVCSEPRKQEREFGKRGKDLYATQSASAAIQNMLLMAADRGIGACWVGAFEEGALKTTLEIPATIKVEAVVPVGYSEENPVEPVKYDLVDLVFLNKWQGKVKYPHLALDQWGSITSRELGKASKATQSVGKKLVEKGKEHVKKLHQKLKEKVRK